jgi:hypothetical protein
MLGRKARIVGLIAIGLSLAAQGALAGEKRRVKSVKAEKPSLIKVRQKDGSVMVRLKLHTSLPQRGTAPPVVGGTRDDAFVRPSEKMDQWLDAASEPRIMTALAAVAVEPGESSRALNQAIDPASVRNWAEFIDPQLYWRWQMAGLDPRFNQAIHNRPQDARMPQRGIFLSIQIALPPDFQAGSPAKPTIWSGVYDNGPSGQTAAREWLTLPMADPKANPWLRTSQSYRY